MRCLPPLPAGTVGDVATPPRRYFTNCILGSARVTSFVQLARSRGADRALIPFVHRQIARVGAPIARGRARGARGGQIVRAVGSRKSGCGGDGRTGQYAGCMRAYESSSPYRKTPSFFLAGRLVVCPVATRTSGSRRGAAHTCKSSAQLLPAFFFVQSFSIVGRPFMRGVGRLRLASNGL